MTTESGQLREGFTYDAIHDQYLCAQGKTLHFHAIRMETGYPNRYYFAQISDCKVCPIKQACCGNKVRQVLTVTAYQPFYQRMQHRLESREVDCCHCLQLEEAGSFPSVS